MTPPVKPERYTTDQVIEAIQQTKGMLTLAARRLNCDPRTVRNYIERHSTVAQAFKEQREGFLDTAEIALMKAVQEGQGWAIAFALKTIGRSRGYVETTRNLNLNLTPDDIAKMNDAELDTLYTQLIDAHRG